MTTINSLIDLKPEKVNQYVSKLGLLFRSILENSREELVYLEKELEIVLTYLELQSNFSQKFDCKLVLENGLKTKDILIPPMFIQPFVENTVAHGFKGVKGEKINIIIAIDPKDKCVHCQIKDNGIGYLEGIKGNMNKNKSLSGQILKERLAIYSKTFKSKASYEVKNLENATGTIVNLYLPYQIDL